LWEAEVKGYRLINLEEEISKQSSCQAVVWLSLVAFGQVYKESWGEKSKAKRDEKRSVWLEKPV
jgi:hypothetical protein